MPISHRKNRSLHLPGTGLSESGSAGDSPSTSLNPDEPNMLYALSWFLIFGLLALWSLAAWAVHAVAVWAVSNAGTLTGAATGAEGFRLPEWLAPWVPPEIVQAVTSLLSGLAPAVPPDPSTRSAAIPPWHRPAPAPGPQCERSTPAPSRPRVSRPGYSSSNPLRSRQSASTRYPLYTWT